jgi:hypothetical protein
MNRQRVALSKWQRGSWVLVGLLMASFVVACVTQPDASSSLPVGARELELRGLVSYRRGVNVAIQVRGVDGTFTTSGWTGTATTSGNGSAASCSPRPASSCL